MTQCEDDRVDPLGYPFKPAVPGFQGKLNCKCTIWANNPMYQRRRQDQAFIFSPETLQTAPETIRQKMRSVETASGQRIDGLYLAEKPQYQHNFICATKRQESVDEATKNQSVADEKESKVTPLERLEFYAGIRKDLIFTGIDRGFASLGIDPIGDEDDYLIFVDGTGATYSTAQAAHHTWINTGSLYTDYIVRPSEENIEPEDDLQRLDYQYSSRWGYSSVNSATNTYNSEGIETIEGPDWLAPAQLANKQGSPVAKLQELYPSSAADNVWTNTNPGIHWRVVKRTPLFQGQDFYVEITKDAISSDIPNLADSRFKMRDEFKYLDIHSIPEGGTGTIPQEALIEVDDEGNVDINALKRFDFTRQAYYMIQLGAGMEGPIHDECHNLDQGHEYWIIIPENSNPIFCHAGVVYEPKPIEEEGDTQSQATTAQDGTPCGDGSTSDDGPIQTIGITDQKKLRRLSTYRAATGRTLFRDRTLRVQVRQHLGKIIVTFSGQEDNPWIIERSDLEPRPSNEEGCTPSTIQDFATTKVPMVIAPAPIAIMGGNIRCSFSFATLTYDIINETRLPQNYSILGPVEREEINLFLRDKGVSKRLETSSNQAPSDDESEESFEYSQDAEIFQEVLLGERVETKAIENQPDLVKRRGKAPCAQAAGDLDGKRSQSTIGIAMKRTTRTTGSESPYSLSIQVGFKMTPGDYLFPSIEGDGDNGDGWMLQRCITPIMNSFRLFVPSKGNAFDKEAIDVSHHVMQFEDSWSEKDLLTIDHTGSIKFLINSGMEFIDVTDHSSYLASLIDKAFYLQIAVWWEGGVMPLPPLDQDRVLFTGLCHGGEITVENNERVLSCQIEDYGVILRNQIFMNSPFFDKMRDFNAVYEILDLAGFRDGSALDDNEDIDDPSAPASLMKRYKDRKDEEMFFFTIHNGETIINREYALPGSYDVLQEPFLKFRDGEKYWDALVRMGKLSGKVMYFDRLGVFHYDMLPYEQDLFNFQQREGKGDSTFEPIDYLKLAKVHFDVSPDLAGEPEVYRQVFNAYTVKRHVQDVVNEIRIISTTPDGELLIGGHTNFSSLFDPDSAGFLGYPKQFIQQDGIFGDAQTVKWNIKNYTKMFIPPLSINFESIGRNNIKPLDIVSFQGMNMAEAQPLIIGSLTNDINPESHTWVQKYECYWLFPSVNIEWGDSNVVGLSPTGGITETTE